MVARRTFSLRSLLVATAVVAVVAWSVTIIVKQRGFERLVAEFERARILYYEKWLGYQSGTVLPGEVCEASAALVQAERALSPSVESQRNAALAHIERLKLLLEKANVPHDLATAPDQRQIEIIERYLHEAEEAVGHASP